jgi:hypothetical protein
MDCAGCVAGALLLALRTSSPTRSAPSAGLLDSKEEAFLQRALQPDVALRLSAAQLLDANPYIRFGPERQHSHVTQPSSSSIVIRRAPHQLVPEYAASAAATLHERKISRASKALDDIVQGYD